MKKSQIFVILAAILWGIIGIFVKSFNEAGFSSLQVVLIRAFTSALILLIYMSFKDRSLLKINIKDFYYFIGTGIFSFVFFNWCYFIAISKTSLSIAAILLYTAPAFVTLLSFFILKEKITVYKLISLLFTFLGCILVTGYFKGCSQDISPLGILAGIGSGFGYALYSIFGKAALKKYNPLTVTAYTFIFAAVGLLPFSNFSRTALTLINKGLLLHALALGLVSTVLPFIFYTKGLKNLEPSKAAIIATLEPVVATSLGVIAFNERIDVSKILGVLLVIFAIIILNRKTFS